MSTNGHLAGLGAHSDKTAYEHGVQAVDESKEFKYGSQTFRAVLFNPPIAPMFNSYQPFVV